MSLRLIILDFKVLDIQSDFIGVAVILAAIIFIPILKYLSKNWSYFCKLDEIDVGIGGVKVKIKNTYKVRQVAYSIWTEMSTRTIGIPIDTDNDVINEIYDSWYQFFSIARNLIKDIPADEAQTKNTQALIMLTMNLLNNEIRSHLTKWQARFRRWYKLEIENNKNPDDSPQKIQKRYAVSEFENYSLLIKDLNMVNERIIEYKKDLEKLIFNKPIINCK